ncbi:hypothetical protein, partial [Mesotoga sp.]|uniref:hypothetical protein n=1 Tax=Mesotoga sp. TaxID=2053577 RepID=UPI00345E4607
DDVHDNFYSSTFPFDFYEHYEELISEFQTKGYSVSLASDVGFFPENYGAVLIAVPTVQYSSAEKSSLSTLLGLGGKVIILGEWYSYYDNTPLNQITGSIGVDIEFNNNELKDNVHNFAGDDDWITTTRFESNPITSGLGKIALFAACSLNVGYDSAIIASAEPTAFAASSLESNFLDSSSGSDQEIQSYDPQVTIVVPIAAVANVGFGKVFAIGDSNIFADEPDSYIPGDYIDVFDNRRLLRNVINW